MAFYMSFYDRKRINDWMNDPERVPGATRKQVGYLRDVRELNREFGRNGVMLFYMVTVLEINECRSMMNSAKRQRTLLWALRKSLKEYRVDPKWNDVFEYDLNAMHNRSKQIWKIVKENIRLTEHYPYFEAVGFDRLENVPEDVIKIEPILAEMTEDMKAWEAEHPEEIREHLEAIRHEVEVRDRHKAELKAKEDAEKQARKERKAKERAEQRETEMIRHREAVRKRKLEREFDTVMKNARI